MNKRVLLLLFFLTFCFPLGSTALPEKPLQKIIKLIEKEYYVSAKKMLDRFLVEHPDDIWHLRALYLKGELNIKLSRPKEAVENFSNLLPVYPQFKDYTLSKLAETYLELGEEKKSIELLKRLIKEVPLSRLISQSKFLLGKLHFNLGDLDKAFKIFDGITNKYPKSDLVPESLFLMGVILEKQGNMLNAYKTYVKLFHSFPLNEFAIKAGIKIREMRLKNSKLPEFPPKLISKRMELLIKKGEYSMVSLECKKYLKKLKDGPLYRNLTIKLGRVYLFMKKRDEALQIFKSYIKKYPSSSFVPEALYNIANIFWNQGKYSKAIEYCKKIINKYPSNTFAEKGHYVLGRILEQKKNYRQAISMLEKMVNKYPHGSYASSGYWRIGWIHYLSGDYQKAAEIFSKTASKFSNSPIRDMLLYWAGKSNEKIGRTEAARVFYQQVAKEYPYNYYAHRSKTRLNNKPGHKVKIINPFFQRSLEKNFLSSEGEFLINSEDRFHYARLKELMALGFFKSALGEIRLIARHVAVNTPKKILWVGNLYYQAEGYLRSLELMEGFLKELPHKKQIELSPEFWKLFFPLAYREKVQESARAYQLDPFFIEGLIRQESAFDPDSLSRSGAIGLMQLMPETGKNEFRKRYKGKFHLEKLYLPGINISLGSQHLAYLFSKTNNDPILALAGYNAGLSRAIKWKKKLKTNDPDVFIEMVPFRETRMYIKKVLRNYFNYIMLYGEGEEQDKILVLNEKDF